MKWPVARIAVCPIAIRVDRGMSLDGFTFGLLCNGSLIVRPTVICGLRVELGQFWEGLSSRALARCDNRAVFLSSRGLLMNALMQPDVNQETNGLIAIHICADPVVIVSRQRPDVWDRFGPDKIEMARRYSSRLVSEINDYWPSELPAVMAFPYVDQAGTCRDWKELVNRQDYFSCHWVCAIHCECKHIAKPLFDVCEKVFKELEREYQVNEGIW
jgi:hypothetical protein